MSSPARPRAAQLRVALLTHSLTPHTLPVCEHISRCVGEFRAFFSAEVDRYHNFPRADTSFPVTVQRSFNRLQLPSRALGSWERRELHVPYDTYSQLRAYRPDCIISLESGVRTVLAALYRLRRPGVGLILWAPLSEHTEEQRTWARRVLRRWILQQVDAVFVNGAQGKAYLHTLGYRGEVVTTPYSIEEGPFRSDSYRPRPGRFRLLYAGRLVPLKGVAGFCTVLSQWCADHPSLAVELDIVGDGPDERLIRSLVLPANLTISITGSVAQEQLAEHLREADMLAFPTLWDEWGVIVNEAMIAGLPILGSTCGQAVVELVEEGVNGWRFDARDPASLGSALDRAFACSVEDLRTLSRQAKQKIAQISPEVIGARAVEAVERICAQASEGAANRS